MKGDFTKWAFEPLDNFTGVLHQQGRVLLDEDWNASNAVSSYLRQMQGRDAIGSNIAAVPAEAKDSFKVVQASTDGATVDITLNPGRVWVDGLLLQVSDTVPYTRAAAYLAPPIQDPQADPADIIAGTEDAVVLEVWEEAFNGFQDPPDLIEPALGGVDTTERVKLFHDLKLLRLAAGDECGNLADKLADDFAAKGKLTVVPSASSVIVGDCPVDLGGGYTGSAHHLFRIEIADPDGAGHARFKWSRFNGGLVGRGTYDPAAHTVTVTGNNQMINHCGLPSFYLEALKEDPEGGRWTVEFTADATLAADGTLTLVNDVGPWPGDANGKGFFRLWDKISLISAFPPGLAAPNELVVGLGIRLEFEPPAANNANYTPGDYWTFPVRTSGTGEFDPATEWPSNAPPQGIHYHRVPLAILEWDAAPPTAIDAPDEIHDCRRIFQPLARLDSCCEYTVGDGMKSTGDFDSIQDAIDELPAEGGRICVLPGEYHENIEIEDDNIVIHGCGPGSRLIAATNAPAVLIAGAAGVTLQGLAITAHDDGLGVLLEAGGGGEEPENIVLKDLTITAATRCAVEADAGRFVSLLDSRIVMRDVPSAWPGVYLAAQDVLVEHNVITVAGTGANAVAGQELTVSAGRGGLQLGGGADRVQIIDNLIDGGIGNGITLGSVEEVDGAGDVVLLVIGWPINADDPCDPCAPGGTYYPPNGGNGGPTYRSAGPLYDIRIERNRILGMGLNGIGVVAFFNLDKEDEFISVEDLTILGNIIRGCLTREIEKIPDDMRDSMGYGGVSLADVENLVMHDNVIEDNGPDHLHPICGVFILHGEGIDISRNRILNNGQKTENSASGANPGPRGGIHIAFGAAPKMPVLIRGDWFPRQNGVTAVKITGNIVAQPLGRALSVVALGPVAVESNQFTSQGMVYDFTAPSFFASTVLIFNLGISNEFYLQQFLFAGDDLSVGADVAPDDDVFIVRPRKGLDDRQLFAYLGNGNVMFNDNQVMLDLIDTTGFKLAMASIVIVSLDDVGFEDNQCDASFDFIFDDFVLSQAFLIGWTLRAVGNRFKETLFGALYSAITIALFANATAHNQGTHCIRAFNLVGSENLHDEPNAVLFDIWNLCPVDVAHDEKESDSEFFGLTGGLGMIGAFLAID